MKTAKKKKKPKDKKTPRWLAVYKEPVVDKKPPRMTTMVCSHCKGRTKVGKWLLMNNTRLRCEDCGGPLNKPSQA